MMTAPLAPTPEAVACTVGLAYLRARLNGDDASIAEVVERVTGNVDAPVRSMLVAMLHELDQAEGDPSINVGVVLQMTIEDMTERLARLQGATS